jgi:hypothetical protein
MDAIDDWPRKGELQPRLESPKDLKALEPATVTSTAGLSAHNGSTKYGVPRGNSEYAVFDLT